MKKARKAAEEGQKKGHYHLLNLSSSLFFLIFQMAMIGLVCEGCGTQAFVFATSLLLNGDNALALQGWVLFFLSLSMAYEWMCLCIEISGKRLVYCSI